MIKLNYPGISTLLCLHSEVENRKEDNVESIVDKVVG